MKRPLLARLSLLSLIALSLGWSSRALTPTEWKFRQSVRVAAPGLVALPIPPATFDASLPALADLRLVDPSGHEVSYLLDTPPPPPADSDWSWPAAFQATPGESGTQLLITTGTKEPLELLELQTTAPFFLKAAHVDISSDGREWKSLSAAIPIFRQFGAEQLRIALNRRAAAFVRVTFDDLHNRPATFTGARLLRASRGLPPPPLVPIGARIVRRDEFVGETVLTVALDGRLAPLAQLSFEVKEPLFMRRVTVSYRDVHGSLAEDRVVASGTIYRVALDGSPARAQLELPVEFTPPTREVLVHIHNADSPPLTIDGLGARQHPVNLFFFAPAPGQYSLLTGNAQTSAPHYDLAAFAGDLRKASAQTVAAETPEPMPGYHPRESLAGATLPDVPLAGAALDAKPWKVQRAIAIVHPGVQELELDPAALARSLGDFADLRVLHAGNQIPYVLERPNLSRALVLTAELVKDPKRPAVSQWKLTLPNAGLPLTQLVLASPTSLFERQLRIFERLTDRDGSTYEIMLASGTWSRTPEPGLPGTLAFPITDRVRSTTIWIETDNGDNPAIVLGSVQAIYPVVRLVFKVAETDGYTLAYENRAAGAPRYDLSLVAARLLTAPRNPATFSSTPAEETEAKPFLESANVRYLFWGVLALVVAGLLAIVAKLLPKPGK